MFPPLAFRLSFFVSSYQLVLFFLECFLLLFLDSLLSVFSCAIPVLFLFVFIAWVLFNLSLLPYFNVDLGFVSALHLLKQCSSKIYTKITQVNVGLKLTTTYIQFPKNVTYYNTSQFTMTSKLLFVIWMLYI